LGVLLPEREGRRLAHAAIIDVAFAEQRRADMGQRCEIPGCADGTFRRHDRRNLSVQQEKQSLGKAFADAGRARGDGRQLEHDGAPHHRLRQGCSDSGRVGQHQPPLQLPQRLIIYALAGKRPKSGVDPIDHGAVPDEPFKTGMGATNVFPAAIGEPYLGLPAQGPQILEPHGARFNKKIHQSSPSRLRPKRNS
jgi:hypothetical protein